MLLLLTARSTDMGARDRWNDSVTTARDRYNLVESGAVCLTAQVDPPAAAAGGDSVARGNDPDNPFKAFEVDPESLFVGHIRPGEIGKASVKITRTDGKKLVIAKTESDLGVVVQVELAEDRAEQSATIIATVKADGSSRHFSSQVKVYTEDLRTPALTIPIQGRFLGEIVLEPEKLLWNISDPTFATEADFAEATTRIVYIYAARQGQSLDFPSISCSLTNVDVGLVTVEKGKSYNLVATLISVPADSIRGFITMETNLQAVPVVKIPIMINLSLTQSK